MRQAQPSPKEGFEGPPSISALAAWPSGGRGSLGAFSSRGRRCAAPVRRGPFSALAVNQIQCPPSAGGLASLFPPCCSRITPTPHRIPGSPTDLRDHMPLDTVLAVCYLTNCPYRMLPYLWGEVYHGALSLKVVAGKCLYHGERVRLGACSTVLASRRAASRKEHI